MEKQMHVSTCSIADAASGFFLFWPDDVMSVVEVFIGGFSW
jgi:hypothetical protein